MRCWKPRNLHRHVSAFSLHLRAADFGHHLPGFIKDRQPLRLGRVSTCQAAAQGTKKQVLKGEMTTESVTATSHSLDHHVVTAHVPLTLGKPASSQSLIMPMKSVARAATNSGRNALMTEFSSKALWETCSQRILFIFNLVLSKLDLFTF